MQMIWMFKICWKFEKKNSIRLECKIRTIVWSIFVRLAAIGFFFGIFKPFLNTNMRERKKKKQVSYFTIHFVMRFAFCNFLFEYENIFGTVQVYIQKGTDILDAWC